MKINSQALLCATPLFSELKAIGEREPTEHIQITMFCASHYSTVWKKMRAAIEFAFSKKLELVNSGSANYIQEYPEERFCNPSLAENADSFRGVDLSMLAATGMRSYLQPRSSYRCIPDDLWWPAFHVFIAQQFY